MKLTCLSEGRGFHFPSCYIIDVEGFQILLDCPIDLSVLPIFSPVPIDSNAISYNEESDSSLGEMKSQKTEMPLSSNNLIKSEPSYRIVESLQLWDISFINIVLISSPMSMLGLPFITRKKGFSAKVYATEATVRIGQLLMEDLVAMHAEYKQFYGPQETRFPSWMKWENLEMLPSALRDIVLGKDGSRLGGWVHLYSSLEVKDCMQKVQTLKYAEESCYNGSLIIKAVSSGLEIGSCNWTIRGQRRSIACLSSSIFLSAHAMGFDYLALQGYDTILYSDPSFHAMEDSETGSEPSAKDSSAPSDPSEVITKSLLDDNESLEEMEKIVFICSCAVDSVKAGGSVLIPIGRVGIILQILEHMSISLESSNLKVPIFMISSVAEQLLAFSNIIPEWVCKQRLEKMYSGESLFVHVDLIKEKKLHLFPSVYSAKLLSSWQEPCIVFCPHWSLRLGPVVHLLQRWSGDANSLLVMEEGVDAELALLPFKPVAMKVLQCSFLCGIKTRILQPLLTLLRPKILLAPDKLIRHVEFSNTTPFSVIHYFKNKTLHLPGSKLSFSKLHIAADLATHLNLLKLKGDDGLDIARLKGELLVENGKHQLILGNSYTVSTENHNNNLMLWGSVYMQKLVDSLQNAGIKVSSVDGDLLKYIVHIVEPHMALIEVSSSRSVISTDDEKLASLISGALHHCLQSI
ncbi:integrator complex subunit 9 homolog [Impatiens glandulifera]|uniref:integrator complex subunit 9 homolog n=1 Tax=Impatiens glandulifera TaxID=253017 RepID=UPI001FB0B5EE|nr:integrator complex subunit 9 homolog [Impatiens glandulifera]